MISLTELNVRTCEIILSMFKTIYKWTNNQAKETKL